MLTGYSTTYRVLMVEDDEIFYDFAREALRSESYQIDRVSDGRAALRRLAEARFDLILTDLKMPVLNGMKFMEISRTYHRSLPPIIVASALIDEESMLKVRRLGPAAFLSKPVTANQLRTEIYRVLQTQRAGFGIRNSTTLSMSSFKDSIP